MTQEQQRPRVRQGARRACPRSHARSPSTANDTPFGFDVNKSKGNHLWQQIIKTVDFNTWQKTVGDPSAKWHKPEFRDPQNFDFTLPPDSPLKAMKLLEYRLDSQLRAELDVMWDFAASNMWDRPEVTTREITNENDLAPID